MRTRFLLGFLAYVLPTFPIGWFWHMTVFKSYYDGLEVYRDDLLVPLGLASIVVQGVQYAVVSPLLALAFARTRASAEAVGA